MNLHIMHKYFPNKIISTGIRRFFFLLFILYIIVGAVLSLLFFYGFSEEMSVSDPQDRNTGALIFLVGLAFNFILTLFIILMQWKLPRLLTLNNKQRMQELVNDIGKEE